MAILTDADLAFYNANGFVGPQRPLFEGAELQKLNELILPMINHNPAPGERTEILNLINKEPDFLDFIVEDKILDIIEKIIGPNFGLRESSAIIKLAGSNTNFKWHSDFNQNEFREEIIKIESVVLLVALTPSTLVSGGLQFIPKSHLIRSKRKYEIPPGSDSPVSVEVPRGCCSLHNVHSLHSSGPNQSNVDRILLSFRFFSTDVSSLSPEAIDYLKRTSISRVHLRGRDGHSVCAHTLVAR